MTTHPDMIDETWRQLDEIRQKIEDLKRSLGRKTRGLSTIDASNRKDEDELDRLENEELTITKRLVALLGDDITPAK